MKASRFLIATVFIFSLTYIFSNESKIVFSANKMTGFAAKNNEVTTLIGNASVTVGELTINADEIELSGEDYKFVKAFGNVKGLDNEQGFSFASSTLEYDRETEMAIFHGSASFNDTQNNVEASAEYISYNKKTETALFQANVNLKKDSINCKSNYALYRRDISILDLTGNPTVTRDGDEFSASRISVNLDTEHITLDGRVSGKVKDEKKAEPQKTNIDVEEMGTELEDKSYNLDSFEQIEEEMQSEEAKNNE